MKKSFITGEELEKTSNVITIVETGFFMFCNHGLSTPPIQEYSTGDYILKENLNRKWWTPWRPKNVIVPLYGYKILEFDKHVKLKIHDRVFIPKEKKNG